MASLICCPSRKFKIWQKLQTKISKIASPSIKIYRGTTALASIRERSVFFSYDWSPVSKNEEVFIRFISAYMGDHKKSTQSTDFCPKSRYFSTEDKSCEKKSFIFHSVQV